MAIAWHEKHLRRAMVLAQRGRGFVSPNPVVGAVLVRGRKMIAEDWHRRFGEGHAERNLLERYKGKILSTDVLYLNLEPCCHGKWRNERSPHWRKKTPPCTEIILEKGIKKLVVGLLDPNPAVSGKGVALLRKRGIEVTVLPQLSTLNSELQWQNRFFFKWVQKHMPWVTLKIAQSLDGRIVQERGTQLWLTGKESQQHVHQMRALYDAILVGVGTVITDNPRLMVRDKKNKSLPRQPKVIVLDAALSIPLTSEVVRPGTIVFQGRQFRRRIARKKQLIDKGVEVLEVDTNAEGYLSLEQILHELGARGIASVYVEGGPTVWSSFLRSGLADELMVYFAPKFLGAGLETFPELGEKFGLAKRVQFQEMKVLGEDVYWHGSL